MAAKFFSDKDRSNIRWFWVGYMKDKLPWLIFILVLVILQGFVYQQFLSFTEKGLRVIFENGNKGAKMFYGDSMDEVQNFAYLDLKDIIWEGNIDPFGDMKVASFKISAKKA